VQQQRLGRLRANTSFNTNSLNNFLTENAPNEKVLSGEVIVFQNEIQDIFKRLINLSEVPIEIEESEKLKENIEAMLLDKSEA